MFDSSDVQSVFSGNIAEEWEKEETLSVDFNYSYITLKKK